MPNSPSIWCRRWVLRRFGPTTPAMSAASRSEEPRKTCWRSRSALRSARISAPRRRPRSPRAAFRSWRGSAARAETLVGLSGLGDLILTCASPQSRNFALGLALGRGQARPRDKLAEGEFTAPVLMELAASQDIDMPVSNAVADILRGAKTIDDAIEGLLARPFKAEG